MSELDRPGGGASFLVRLWREPRTSRGGEIPARVYVRNLRTGSERYLKDATKLAELLERDASGGGTPAEADDKGLSRPRAG